MTQPCKFEDKIIKLCEDTAEIKATVKALDKRINGSINAVEEHIKHGTKWRALIIGIIVTIVLNIIAFAANWGRINERVAGLVKQLERCKGVSL